MINPGKLAASLTSSFSKLKSNWPLQAKSIFVLKSLVRLRRDKKVIKKAATIPIKKAI